MQLVQKSKPFQIQDIFRIHISWGRFLHLWSLVKLMKVIRYILNIEKIEWHPRISLQIRHIPLIAHIGSKALYFTKIVDLFDAIHQKRLNRSRMISDETS
jgi:hypothetical protein